MALAGTVGDRFNWSPTALETILATITIVAARLSGRQRACRQLVGRASAKSQGRSARDLSFPWSSMAMKAFLRTFASDECGATAIEYGLITALIAVFLIGALSALGTGMSSEFAEVGSALK
jgi:pilus assembly protein Flp/PilA